MQHTRDHMIPSISTHLADYPPPSPFMTGTRQPRWDEPFKGNFPPGSCRRAACVFIWSRAAALRMSARDATGPHKDSHQVLLLLLSIASHQQPCSSLTTLR